MGGSVQTRGIVHPESGVSSLDPDSGVVELSVGIQLQMGVGPAQ